MPASREHVSRIALRCLILFLTASCRSIKKYERTAGQAQITNETVPDATSVLIDTSLDQDIRTRHLEEKVPDALLKTGYSYMSMDDESQANDYFKQAITRYPFSPAADKTRQKLFRTQ